MDKLCKTASSRIHAYFKSCFQRFFVFWVHKESMKMNCYKQIKQPKMPQRQETSHIKAWKIDLAHVDPLFAYRIDQAKIGACYPDFSHLDKEHTRRVFKWYLKGSETCAFKRLGHPSPHFGDLNEHAYVAISTQETPSEELEEGNYQKEIRRSREKRLFQVDRIP